METTETTETIVVKGLRSANALEEGIKDNWRWYGDASGAARAQARYGALVDAIKRGELSFRDFERAGHAEAWQKYAYHHPACRVVAALDGVMRRRRAVSDARADLARVLDRVEVTERDLKDAIERGARAVAVEIEILVRLARADLKRTGDRLAKARADLARVEEVW